MNSRPLCSSRLMALLAATLVFAGLPAAMAEEPVALFNGKDLTGWKGDANTWKIEEGAIVGTTTDEKPLEYNQFLIYTGEPVEDFTLTAKLKLTGDSNSGIQYRSKERPDLGDFVVSGYQCDMHPADWANGMIYEEKERGILCKRNQKVVITPEGGKKVVGTHGDDTVFNTGTWLHYKIIARGNHLIHKVNGVVVAELYDHQADERDLKGTIAFQVHKGPAMKIEIRDILLQRLPKEELTPVEATPVPANAEDVEPPKKG